MIGLLEQLILQLSKQNKEIREITLPISLYITFNNELAEQLKQSYEFQEYIIYKSIPIRYSTSDSFMNINMVRL